jgi:two-component system sensor histidine kinase UhpB
LNQNLHRRLWAWSWKNRSISWRLSVIAIIPLMLVTIGEVLYLAKSTPYELRQDLREHGEMFAAAIAENSEHGLTSGKLNDLRRVVRSLVQADKWIYRVDIFDEQGLLKLSVTPKDERTASGERYEARVFRRTLPTGDAEKDDAAGALDELQGSAQTTELIGLVRVSLSEGPAKEKQKRKIYSQSLLLLCVGLISIWVAALLGKALHRPMDIAIRALRQIRGGDYAVRLAVDDGGEMGELLDAINGMSSSLNEAKRDLEEKVQARTRDLETSMVRLKKADAEKRRLIQKVDSIVEDERKSIAVEIHDELNAALLGARYSSSRILDMAAALPPSTQRDVIKDSAESILSVTSSLYTSARKIVRRLRPEVLDMLGLQGAIEEMLQTYEAAPGAPTFTFRHSGDFNQVSSALAITAYRLIQECVSNVIKHSGATSAMVLARVSSAAPEQELRVIVIDDGVGFDPDTVPEGIGLIGMKERAQAFSGSLTLKTGAGAGTRIDIVLPLNGLDTARK